MTEAIWWEVFFSIGKHYDWLKIYAHNKDEAGRIAQLQARATHNSSGNVRVISVKKEKIKKLDK